MGNHAAVQRLPETTTPSRGITESVTASHEFEVTNYPALDGVLGAGKSVKSGTFSVGGYDWELWFYPDGDAKDDCAGYASVYLASLSCPPAENVSAKFTLTVLTQRGRVASLDNVRRTFSPTSFTWGLAKFVEKSKLKSPDDDDDGYLIKIRCDLTVPKEPHTECKTVLIEVPPPELPGRLERALKEEKGADVTFLVGGREFRANMFMLASRSLVFDAQLFGPMMEKDTRRVEVVDMEPAIFEMLLHFIYTDSLPPPACDGMQEGGYGTAEMQHLLVAADRYGLDRLKVMCEEKLCRGIKVENVMSTMALADRHCCHRLKDACVAFMSQPDVMGAVVRDDGFKHLIGRCPILGLEEESHESK